MGKYVFTNLETVPFKTKKYDWQLDRYLKLCIADVDNPQKVLFVLPLYGKQNGRGFSKIIEVVRNHELGQDQKSKFHFSDLMRPVDGEFVDVPSMHGPLFRVFTKDEAKYGMCSKMNVGKVERNHDGKVKIYHHIKVFSLYSTDDGEKTYLNGWFPQDLYYRFFGYSYHKLSDLTEPLQIK